MTARHRIRSLPSWLALALVAAGPWLVLAQETPPADPNQPPATQPAGTPESQRALERLAELREQMRKEKEQAKREERAEDQASRSPVGSREEAVQAKRDERDPNAARARALESVRRPRPTTRPAAQPVPADSPDAPSSVPSTPVARSQAPLESAPAAPAIPPHEQPVDARRDDAAAVDAPPPPPAEQPPAPASDEQPRPTEERAATPAPHEGDRTAASGDDTPEDFVGPPLRLSRVRAGRPAGAEGEVEHVDAQPSGAGGDEAVVRRAVDPNEPGEWFTFNKMPWEDVILQFVERIGKPMMDPEGVLALGGELTYISDRKFSKQEAIDELNFILHEKGYRFVERENHIYLVPMSDMPLLVPLSMTFPTVEAFTAAAPRDMDYVAVYYQVKDRPAQVYVEMFGDALPDYSRIVALDDSNQIKIIALAKDVRKFLALKDMIDITPEDPRELKFFDIKTNAPAIERMVRDFLKLGAPSAAQPRMIRDPRTGQMIPSPTSTPDATAEVQIVADDRTNSIIVKATRDKLTEIAELIEKFDQKPELGEFKTKVIEIKHADATEVANLIRDIIQQEQGQAQQQTPQWQQQRMQQIQAQLAAQRRAAARRGQPTPPVPQPQQLNTGGAPEDILLESQYERAKKLIRLTPDPRTNSLIVYANDDGFKRLDQILEIIDKPLPDKLFTIAPKSAKVADIAQLVTQLAETVAPATGGRSAASIVPDEAQNLFYVVAERDQFEAIERLVEQLDIENSGRERHIVALKNLRPSAVASMVQTLLSSSGGSSVSMPSVGRPMRGPVRGRLPGGAPAASTAGTGQGFQVIALDEAQLLIVECSAEDWVKVEETVRMWDEGALSNTPALKQFAIVHGDADDIANTLGGLYRNYQHPVLGASPVTIQADGDMVWVYAIQPAIDEVAALIEQLDVERERDGVEILPLANADATSVAQQVMQVFGGGGRSAAGGRQQGVIASGGAALVVLPEPVTNALIVQADKSDMEKIKDFVMRLDVRVGDDRPEQRFITIKNANPQEVADAVRSIFGAIGSRGARGVAGAGGEVKAFASGNQVVVEAGAEKMKDIEGFIAKLDDARASQVKIKTYKLTGADVTQIAGSLTNAFRARPPRPDKLQAGFQPDTTTESILVTAPPDMFEEIDGLVQQFASGTEDLTLERRIYPIRVADASFVGEKLRNELTFEVKQRNGQIVASRINVTVDERGNQVILSAPKFVHPIAEGLVAELDQAEKKELWRKTIPLANADASAAVGALKPVFADRAAQRRSDKSYVPLSLQAEPLTNAVIAQGGDESDHKQLADELSRMDAQVAEQDVPATTIPLSYANPQEVATMITSMFRSSSSKNQTKDVQVTVSNGLLVVKAPKRKLDEIRELVAQVDEPEEDANIKIKTYDLKVLNAAIVQVAVSQFLQQLGKSARPGGLKPGAYAEPTTNTLVVMAPPESMPFIDGLIAELESKGPRRGEARMYELANTRAETVAPNIDAMLKAKIAEREGVKRGAVQTAVFAMSDANRLYVFAPDEYQELADQLIKMIDQPATNGEIVQIMPLDDGDAAQLATSLTAIVQSRAAKGAAPVRVSADAGSNSIVIAGLAKDVAEVLDWVGELEKNSVRVPELQRFQLKHVSTGKVVETLEKLVGDGRGGAEPVTITEDEYNDTLIVTANRRQMRQVEKYIEQLDIAPSRDDGALFAGGRQLHFVDINRGDASDIAWDVRQFFPDEEDGGPVIESDWFGEYITVKCRESEFPQILSVIRELEARQKEERKVVTRRVRDPRVLEQVAKQSPNVQIVQPSGADTPTTLVEDLWAPDEEPPWKKGKAPAAEPSRTAPPPATPTPASRVGAAERDPADSEAGRDAAANRPRPRTLPYMNPFAARADMIDELEREIAGEPTPAAAPSRADEAAPAAATAAASNGAASDPEPQPLIAEPPTLEFDTSVRRVAGDLKPAYAPAPSPSSESTASPFLTGAAMTAPAAPPRVVRPLRTKAVGVENAGAAQHSGPWWGQLIAAADTAGAQPATSASPTTAPSSEVERLVGRRYPSPLPAPKLNLLAQPDGSWVIEGPEDEVEDLEEVIDAIEADLSVGEVIRIFRFRYGDVSAAAEILTLMFDVQQRQAPIPQQPQQQPQRGQRGQQGAGQPGEEGREGQQNNQQAGLLEQMRQMVGGARQGGADRGAARGQLRMATDPGHNYLIIRCEASMLPEIRQLLKELDIPPGEVKIKIFQLKSLAAEETAENIKDVLGISKAQSRRGSPQPRRGGQNPQQAQLMEMLQQQLVSVPGVEGGAKVERVEIVPNALTNAILVSAPPEVMGLIERVINDLEALEGRNIVGIHYYPLKRAKLTDVLPLLQEIFSESGRGGSGEGLRGARGGSTASPAQMGSISISADPRTNTIIYTAENKDVPIVEAQISKLDIEGPVAESETYVCQFGDAQEIVSAIEPIFVGAGARGASGARGDRGGAGDLRISADPSTNAIIVYGSLEQRDLVFAKIEQLDVLSQRDFKEIPVLEADPEKLAATLLQVFGGAASGGAAPARRPGRGAAAGAEGVSVNTAGRVTIIGNKAAKKLLVKAPDEVYKQIVAMAEALDQPSTDLELKNFELRYAEAQSVVDTVKTALAEYVQIANATGNSADFGAFTAMPDARTNSIVVVGSPEIFAFVANVVSLIDQPTPDRARKDFQIFVLEKADATIVADAINGFAAGSAAAGGGGSRPGGRPGAASGSSGRELALSAVADTANNSVMVYGRADDIAMVDSAVIQKLENALSERTQFARIPVRHVPPSQLYSYISQFLESRGGGESRGQRGSVAEPSGPQVVPNDDAKTLVVQGSERQIADIRTLVEQFDTADFRDQSIKVVQIPPGQDAERLADEITRVINESEQTRAEQSGQPARQVTVVANAYTNALMVSGDPALQGMVGTLVEQLGTVRSETAITRVFELRNLTAQDAERIVGELQQNRRGGGAGSSGRSGIRPSRGGGSPAPRPPSGSPQMPRRRGGGSGSADDLPPLGARPAGAVCSAAGGGLLVTTAPLSPAWFAVFCQATEAPPAATQPARSARRALTPRNSVAVEEAQPRDSRAEALRRAEEDITGVRSASPSTTTSPSGAALPPATADVLSGISGTLQGDVSATAIDSQRIVITGDEGDVEFIENVLRLMEFSTPPAQIDVIRLEHAKAAALAPIIDKAIKAQLDVKGGGVGDAFSVSAEGRSNSLIAAANEVIMGQIRELAKRLDVPKSEGFTDFRTVPLRFMRAAQAVAILRPQVERLNRLNEVPAESQASISALDASNSVLIIGTPKDADDIERLIKAVDVDVDLEDDKAGSFLAADVILVPLENARAEDVATVLTDLIEEQQENARQSGGEQPGAPFVRKLRLRLADGQELPELDLQRPIKVVAEKGTNSLIIFSSRKNNEALQAIVKVFDTLPIGAETDVKAFTLKYASAEQVATLISETFGDKKYLARPSEGEGGLREGILPPVPKGVAAAGLPYPLVVQHDPRSNVVLVIGRRDAVVLAGGLIAELDKPSADLGLKAHVLPLKSAPAGAMAEKVKEILDERAQAVGGDDNTARDSAVIQADERSNALVIFAGDELFGMIEDLVGRLDGARKFAAVDVRYAALRYADASKMQSLLEETFNARQEAESKLNQEATDTLSVQADPRSNSLLLTGTTDYLRDAETLIAQLDRKSDPTVVFSSYKVRLNSAPNVSSLLKDMVEKALSQPDSALKGSPIHIAADPVTDTLLLAAAKEDLDIINRWIEILDRPSEVGRMVRILPLRRAIAEEVATSIGEIFTAQGGGEGASGGTIEVSVVADKTTNSVVAFGPAALLNDVESFVKQLDNTEPTKGAIVRIFQLEQAAAEDAGELLSRILELRGGTVGGQGGGGTGGAASEEAKQVMLVFHQQNPGLGIEALKALRSEIVVISDTRTNSLVVTAPPDGMRLMESLIKAVDVPPQDAKIRVFRLRNGDAEQMVQMLQELFERQNAAQAGGGGQEDSQRVLSAGQAVGGREEIAFTTDVRTNAVIAAGTPGYLDLVEQMILELDTVPIKDRVTFVYEPRNITAEALASSLTEFSEAEQQRLDAIGDDISTQVRQEREIVAIYNEDANRVIIDVDPRFQEEVLGVIKQLDQQPLQVLIQVLILEVSMDNALDLGVEFAFQDLEWTQAGVNDTTTFDYVAGTDIGAAGSGLGGFVFTVTGRDFNFLFRTLQVEGNLKVLSRPQIIVLNNQEARIDVSNDVPYVTGTQTSSTGQISTSVARQSVGIVLEVRPQINPDGYVRLEINQEVSDLTDSTVDVGPGVTAPIFFTREAETVVTVRDNETIVLGGLITSRKSNSETKIPLVGDIPALGTLFRSQNDQYTRRELLLVLTPRVIRSVEELRDESAIERDRLELITDDLLADPLMQDLRLRPGEKRTNFALPPAPLNGDAGGTADPVEPPPAPQDVIVEPPAEEVYGPPRPRSSSAAPKPAAPNDHTAYDVPLRSRGRP